MAELGIVRDEGDDIEGPGTVATVVAVHLHNLACKVAHPHHGQSGRRYRADTQSLWVTTAAA